MTQEPTHLPLALDLLLTADQRRPLSAVEKQIAFQAAISTPSRAFDEVDELIDDLTVVDPYECHAPSRRSDKEVANLLDLLDNLETGIDRKETM